MPAEPTASPDSPAFHPSSASGVPAEVAARLRAAGCVFAEEEAALLLAAVAAEADAADRLEAMIRRRVAGEPLELVLGWAEFGGLRVAVAPGVFIPRRRSEFMLREAAAYARARCAALGDARPLVVVDLCCGTGALGLALTAELSASAPPAGIELLAADIDPAAVDCARRNLPDGRVFLGDLFAALPPAVRGRIDVLLANVPYVPSDEVPLLPAEARDHEPLQALDGGADGLDVLRRVAAAAPDWLAPGGRLFVETSSGQVPSALEVLGGAALAVTHTTDEDTAANVLTAIRR
ncbi:putative protein N(5)-glutamine methyltransferase [Phaeacidiphilus oryzae]|uniref:putative protein N(5)-glutamine methyltransferase n=1 Tax=Phaeacidiphilus oryzae TaxID=348818 RepID=UPI00056458B8|nr:putative protein N(5)-glutamine methyltransferase [Phaeacidiphilus oryzae]